MYGEKIRMVRILRNLSQEVIADHLGVEQNTYSKYETNQIRISPEHIKKLAKFFGVSEEDLKSQNPIVMNFNHSDNGGYHNNSTFNQNIDLVKQLSTQLLEKDKQLEEKDKQIGKLLSLLEKKK
jgi:transcriptional regulator with XRE-family HTH domain